MQAKATITINGRRYDPVTGMPAGEDLAPRGSAQPMAATQSVRPLAIGTTRAPARTVATTGTAASSLHHSLQRSQTLLRSALKRPALSSSAPPARAQTATGHVQAMPPRQPSRPISSKELKELLIKERLAEVREQEAVSAEPPRRFFAWHSRLTAVLASTMAALVFGSYLMFLNLPVLSLRVAAAQAGIAANFPNYVPEGYHFQGPVTYAPGSVAVTFAANTSGQHLSIKQERSTWDSKAVLDNYVSKVADAYLTYQDNGLTVYSYGQGAAWVNGGIFYALSSSTTLGSDQILRIANSL